MTEGPLEICLEFARVESTGDPHAFRFGPQSYVVRTPQGGFAGVDLPWDGELLARLAGVRSPGCDPRLVAEVGEFLRRFLAPAGWEFHELQITAAIQRHRDVHVTIRSAAAELFVLPWELLTLRATAQSLGGLPGVLIRHEWPETFTRAPPDASRAGGRILVAWSAAGGAVPAAGHIAAIRDAARAGGLEFAPDDVLPHASPGRLAAALAAGDRGGRPVAALHLLCHGGARDSGFGLLLDGEAGDDPPILLDPARLQQIVSPHAGTLRIVVLAACDSGNQGEPGNVLGSAAQMLHRAGVAAVVASRYPLSAAGSERLTATFYAALLAERASLERAFVAARTRIASDAATLDWASVQLYARAADGGASYPIVAARPAAHASPPAPRARARVALPSALVGLVALALAAIWGRDSTGVAAPSEPDPPPASDGSAAQAATPGPPQLAPPSASNETPGPSVAPAVDPPGKTPAPAAPEARKKAPVGRASVECPSAVQSYVRALLPSEGTRVVRLTISAGADGSLLATGKDPAIAAARARLSGASVDKVRRYAGDALPCHLTHEWSVASGAEG